MWAMHVPMELNASPDAALNICQLQIVLPAMLVATVGHAWLDLCGQLALDVFMVLIPKCCHNN